jgi:hypothetical protein
MIVVTSAGNEGGTLILILEHQLMQSVLAIELLIQQKQELL